MLTLDECIAMSELTEDEVAVIAEHEHVPLMAAVGIGENLLRTPKGVFRLKGMITDCLEHACVIGDLEKVKHLDGVLTRFNHAHPVPRVLGPAPRRGRLLQRVRFVRASR